MGNYMNLYDGKTGMPLLKKNVKKRNSYEANKKVVAKQPTDSKEVPKEAKCQKEEVK